ncbi:hypothetical protein [Nocardia sp. NPDC059229]|uniref:hypothetical protein n=1 Tax=Nocardia sp. NPDC059229 TaxID=3346778 RepID=UPI00368EB74B
MVPVSHVVAFGVAAVIFPVLQVLSDVAWALGAASARECSCARRGGWKRWGPPAAR